MFLAVLNLDTSHNIRTNTVLPKVIAFFYNTGKLCKNSTVENEEFAKKGSHLKTPR
jgi:hypothetical protein